MGFRQLMPRDYVDLQIFKNRAKWSEQIVRKDQDFQDYAGADLDTANKLAMLDVFLRCLNTDPTIAMIGQLYRTFLIQRKKAFFCSVRANEVTQLAFLKGKSHDAVSAIAE